ncbi:hypothetical protein RCH18_002486 [Flavobacterium sp. PL11]|uniref:DUF3293 domain-containing protein n=1 Tax=Flavobacterium sp. PL11 TaxID=3071717 RepID=UPI002E0B9A0A|nr:hypothetical protein [Flavobacterium sp. PL11]
MNQELLEAYSNTNYHVFNPKLLINIGKENIELNIFLKEKNYKSWCYITAWNPLSASNFTIEDNTTLNNQLLEDIKKYPNHIGEGKDAEGIWPGEESYFVCNISKEKSIELGKKYKQNAIVFGTINEMAELIILEKLV